VHHGGPLQDGGMAVEVRVLLHDPAQQPSGPARHIDHRPASGATRMEMTLRTNVDKLASRERSMLS
jgi:hypothetical protein